MIKYSSGTFESGYDLGFFYYLLAFFSKIAATLFDFHDEEKYRLEKPECIHVLLSTNQYGVKNCCNP
jgi:hypothetical protein